MKKQKQTWTLEILTSLLVIAAALVVVASNSQFGYGASIGPNYRNVTIDTRVNITNSFPEIIGVTISPSPITLNAGSSTQVSVNVSVRDFDGFADIAGVNATFFDGKVVEANASDDNNDHYTNSTCTAYSTNGFFANYTCGFSVQYYANDGLNWTANATAFDASGSADTESAQTTMNILLALNVTDLIDYGNLAVGDISAASVQANITNFGNVDINVSLYGYGNITGDGLALKCEQRNISIDNERFTTNATDMAWADMLQLTGSSALISNLSIIQRTNDTVNDIVNSTYWKLRVPVSTNPAGQCNGSIVFQAEAT